MGSLASIIDADRIRREIIANTINLKNKDDLKMLGLATTFPAGPLILGSFGIKPDCCIRSFILSKVDELKLKDNISVCVEAAKLISTSDVKSKTVPELLCLYRDSNAFHIVFNAPVINDLSSVLKLRNNSNSLLSSNDVILYVAASLIMGVECIHKGKSYSNLLINYLNN